MGTVYTLLMYAIFYYDRLLREQILILDYYTEEPKN